MMTTRFSQRQSSHDSMTNPGMIPKYRVLSGHIRKRSRPEEHRTNEHRTHMQKNTPSAQTQKKDRNTTTHWRNKKPQTGRREESETFEVQEKRKQESGIVLWTFVKVQNLFLFVFLGLMKRNEIQTHVMLLQSNRKTTATKTENLKTRVTSPTHTFTRCFSKLEKTIAVTFGSRKENDRGECLAWWRKAWKVNDIGIACWKSFWSKAPGRNQWTTRVQQE